MIGNADTTRCIAALDIGTTNVRCLIINSNGLIVGKAHQKVKIYRPHPGWMEIDPDELYASILEVINLSIQDANISFNMVKSLAISIQRATFTTWKKDTGEHLHNFITWQDQRAEQLVKEINSSWLLSCFRYLSALIYGVVRRNKFKLTSHFNVTCAQVSSRLLWVLSNLEEVKECLQNDNLLFGTLDTWLLYKLTGGRLHVTDFSNASATGFFDSFELSWGIIPSVLRIPRNILPKVVENDYCFGSTSEDIFEQPLSIGCVMGDQNASVFGSGCYNEDILKVTIGTGAFIDVNTVDTIHPCLTNMYPIIGWKVGNVLNYLLEIPCLNSGSLINWLQNASLINDPSESSDMAFRVKRNYGLYFFPESNLQEFKIDTLFIGITSKTTREDKVKAVLECIVYKIIIAYQLLLTERKKNYKIISVDGGVANNNFICQLLADLSNFPVRRMASTEMSSMGVAYIAGLASGIWKDQNEIESLQAIEKTFYPTKDKKYKEELITNFEKWCDAVKV